jgi:hypothetical protein
MINFNKNKKSPEIKYLNLSLKINLHLLNKLIRKFLNLLYLNNLKSLDLT